MAAPETSVSIILNYSPHDSEGKPLPFDRDIKVGELSGGEEVRYGLRSIRTRSLVEEGEPFTGRDTLQPVTYIKRGKEITTLAYRTDIERIDIEVAEEIAQLLRQKTELI